jgi:hypothetical protein
MSACGGALHSRTTYVLSVNSTNPSSGVSIGVAQPDVNGAGNGSTNFTRTYMPSASVTLTAPATAGGNAFSSWIGCANFSTVTCNLTVNANTIVTAVYAASTLITPTVTVTSATDIPATQPLTVTIAASGGNGNSAPTGSVTLTGSGYSSAITPLAAGSATITVPANSLSAGTDTLTATYTPDTASSGKYASATGTESVTVTSASSTTPTLAFSASIYYVSQSAGSVTLTVNRTGDSSGEVSVNYTSGGNTAVQGTDYTVANGALTWAAGDTTPKTITVPISNAVPFVGSKAFTVSIWQPSTCAVCGLPYITTVAIAGSSQPWPQPAPQQATGSTTPGSQIMVTGSNFGATGPTILFMDGFENATPGSTIPLAADEVGAYTSQHSDTLATSNAHTGSVGYEGYNNNSPYESGGAMRSSTLVFPNAQEIFISLWTEIPAGKSFPGDLGIGSPAYGQPGYYPPPPGQFSADSSAKFAWLMDETYNNPSQFSLICFTQAGLGWFAFGGEYNDWIYGADLTEGTLNWNAVYSLTSWNRTSFWARGGKAITDPTTQSTGFQQVLNTQFGLYSYDFGLASVNPLFSSTVTPQFNTLNIPGWFRDSYNLPNVEIVYDDVYIAVGPGSVARVEITDAPTYTQSRHATILKTVTWSDSQITATIPAAGLDSSGSLYLYVTNSDGETNASGIPIATGGS